MDPHSFYLLDPDPHSEKLLDPDPQKMNAEPQPCLNISLTSLYDAHLSGHSWLTFEDTSSRPGLLADHVTAGAGQPAAAALLLHLHSGHHHRPLALHLLLRPEGCRQQGLLGPASLLVGRLRLLTGALAGAAAPVGPVVVEAGIVQATLLTAKRTGIAKHVRDVLEGIHGQLVGPQHVVLVRRVLFLVVIAIISRHLGLVNCLHRNQVLQRYVLVIVVVAVHQRVLAREEGGEEAVAVTVRLEEAAAAAAVRGCRGLETVTGLV